MVNSEEAIRSKIKSQHSSGVGASPVSPDKSGPLFVSFCVAHAFMHMKRLFINKIMIFINHENN